jgi:hypothetical protein
MPVYDDPIGALAVQVRSGEASAVAEFRQELAPRLTQVVRQVLRTRSSRSLLDRRILRELARARRAGEPCSRRRLVARVVRRLCARVIARLRRHTPAPAGLQDTVRGL